MKACVIVFPGSNCDRDIAVALRRVSGAEVDMVWHAEGSLPKTDLVVLPGGFSYGDYLRCGAIAANSPVMRDVVRRAKEGVPTLGVCNGFQILLETGLLPGALINNAALKYVCRTVALQVESSQKFFTSGYEQGTVISIPVAHHDGQYFADEATLDQLEAGDRIAFRYVDDGNGRDSEQASAPARAANPNGSARNIAGIYNAEGNVMGMMPHPERAVDAHHGGTDGIDFFRSLADSLN